MNASARNLWITIVALVAAVAIMVGGVTWLGVNSQPAPEPSPSPSVSAPIVETVNPGKVIDALPDSPKAYDTSDGTTKAPDAAPNGTTADGSIQAPPDAPAVVIDGLGGATITYARQSAGGNRPRFTPPQAVAVAVNESQHHTSGRDWRNLCEGFAGGYVWGWGYSGNYSAKSAFYSYPSGYVHKITTRNVNNVPAGAVIYWSAGTYGHATLSLGAGKLASTDILRQGLVDLVPITLVANRWFGGDLGYYVDPVWFGKSGGSSGLKAPAVPKPPAIPKPSKPTVSLSKIRTAAFAHTTYIQIPVVRKALGGKSTSTKWTVYLDGRWTRWEKSLGYGSKANRIPNTGSLTRLGAKTGFTVVK